MAAGCPNDLSQGLAGGNREKGRFRPDEAPVISTTFSFMGWLIMHLLRNYPICRRPAIFHKHIIDSS